MGIFNKKKIVVTPASEVLKKWKIVKADGRPGSFGIICPYCGKCVDIKHGAGVYARKDEMKFCLNCGHEVSR